LIQPEKQVD